MADRLDKKTIQFRTPIELHRFLKDEAKRQRVEVSVLVRGWCWEKLDQAKGTKAKKKRASAG